MSLSAEGQRFVGPNHDIPRPPNATIPPALEREMPVCVAVIAEEALTPIGNTADETWENLKAGRSGIVTKLYSPYTEPTYPVPNEFIEEIKKTNPMYERLLAIAGDTPRIRNFILGEYLLENPEMSRELICKTEGRPQIRATTAGTIKNFDPKEALKGILPIPEVVNKMDPFAQYAVYTGVGAARKITTYNSIPFVIPRIGPDGQVDKRYPLAVNPELVHPSQVGIYVGCGFGGGDVSAEVMQRLENGKLPSADHMMRELIDRAASQVAKALNIHGGAEGDVAACASSGKAGVNAIRAIMTGDIDVALWSSTEGVLNRPIASASFDTMDALDKGKDPLQTSLSFHKDRRGFVMADGSVSKWLASIDWVRRFGVTVLYYIIGYGNTSDAGDDTRPNGVDGERALRLSRRRAERQGRIEGKLFESGHYTATPAGENVEFLHTINAYDDLEAQKRVVHGATKRLTGHMLGAAGLMAQFAAGRAIQEGIAWGTPRVGEFMDEAYGYDIPEETRYEPDLTDAVSKTFGFGGSNVAFNSRRAR